MTESARRFGEHGPQLPVMIQEEVGVFAHPRIMCDPSETEDCVESAIQQMPFKHLARFQYCRSIKIRKKNCALRAM